MKCAPPHSAGWQLFCAAGPILPARQAGQLHGGCCTSAAAYKAFLTESGIEALGQQLQCFESHCSGRNSSGQKGGSLTCSDAADHLQPAASGEAGPLAAVVMAHWLLTGWSMVISLLTADPAAWDLSVYQAAVATQAAILQCSRTLWLSGMKGSPTF